MKDKICVISGCAGGIGAATARRFARAGATLALTDIKEPPAGFINSLDGAAPDSAFHPADLADEAQVVELFGWLKSRYPRIDVLVNIAGGDFGAGKAFEETDLDNFSRNIDANLKTTFLCCREAMRIMRPQGHGAIVNMSSLTFRGSSANQFAYSAAKGGVYALTRTLAMTYGRHGIRVNAVAPAMIEVDSIVKALPPDTWQQIRDSVAAGYPLGRIGQPEDVANCILFLASDEAAFVTGQVLEVSGGGRL